MTTFLGRMNGFFRVIVLVFTLCSFLAGKASEYSLQTNPTLAKIFVKKPPTIVKSSEHSKKFLTFKPLGPKKKKCRENEQINWLQEDGQAVLSALLSYESFNELIFSAELFQYPGRSPPEQ